MGKKRQPVFLHVMQEELDNTMFRIRELLDIVPEVEQLARSIPNNQAIQMMHANLKSKLASDISHIQQAGYDEIDLISRFSTKLLKAGVISADDTIASNEISSGHEFISTDMANEYQFLSERNQMKKLNPLQMLLQRGIAKRGDNKGEFSLNQISFNQRQARAAAENPLIDLDFGGDLGSARSGSNIAIPPSSRQSSVSGNQNEDDEEDKENDEHLDQLEEIASQELAAETARRHNIPPLNLDFLNQAMQTIAPQRQISTPSEQQSVRSEERKIQLSEQPTSPPQRESSSQSDDEPHAQAIRADIFEQSVLQSQRSEEQKEAQQIEQPAEQEEQFSQIEKIKPPEEEKKEEQKQPAQQPKAKTEARKQMEAKFKILSDKYKQQAYSNQDFKRMLSEINKAITNGYNRLQKKGYNSDELYIDMTAKYQVQWFKQFINTHTSPQQQAEIQPLLNNLRIRKTTLDINDAPSTVQKHNMDIINQYILQEQRFT